MKLFGFDHHRHQSPWADAPPYAIELREMLVHIIKQETKIMGAIDDLKAATAATPAPSA